MKLPISVIILTLNEEHNIARCLESVADWAGEIFVVDSGSTDATVEIASSYTDAIVTHPFENYAVQRNWAQDNLDLKYDWVFHIDADERVSVELAKALQNLYISKEIDELNGAMFSRRTVFLGRWIRYGGHYPVFHTRLFRRPCGRCEDRRYDQHFLVEPPVKKLTGDLIDVITSNLDTWAMRHIRWAGQEARENVDSQHNAANRVTPRILGNPIEQRRWLRNIVFGKGPLFLRAFAYFFYRYFLRLGFLDGVEGLIFHTLQGFWYRFYVDAKIWETQHQSDKLGGIE